MGFEQRAAEEDEVDLADRCLRGDRDAFFELRATYQGLLTGLLVQRGAFPTEAEDLVGDLFSDCAESLGNAGCLLHKFHRKTSFRSWLTTVALNRLIDLKRRQRFRIDPELHFSANGSFYEQVQAPEDAPVDFALVNLLKEALREAVQACPYDCRLMLALIYLDGISQREIGRRWGWHESKVSRYLRDGMELISRRTLENVRRRDPWLTLSWEDFVEMCRISGHTVFEVTPGIFDGEPAPRHRQPARLGPWASGTAPICDGASHPRPGPYDCS